MLQRVLDSKVPKFVTTGGPQLELTTFSRSAVTLTVNILTSTGVVTRTIPVAALLVGEAFLIPVTEIPTSVFVTPTTSTRDGDLYLRLAFIAGGVTSGVLWAGYCSSLRPLAWPPDLHASQLQQRGNLFSAVTANPAPGADLVITVPTSARFRFLSIRATLTTVGENTPLISATFNDGINNIFRLTSPLVHPAAVARTYEFIARSTKNDIAFNANLEIELSMPEIELPEAATVTLSGQDADDDWGTAISYVEALIE